MSVGIKEGQQPAEHLPRGTERSVAIECTARQFVDGLARRWGVTSGRVFGLLRQSIHRKAMAPLTVPWMAGQVTRFGAGVGPVLLRRGCAATPR